MRGAAQQKNSSSGNSRARRGLALAGLALAALGLGMLVNRSAGAQTFVVLHRFGKHDGRGPHGALVEDAAGNLYGTTTGAHFYFGSYGAVFKSSTAGGDGLLYVFRGGADGAYPYGGLVLAGGYLYGTTYQGGDLACNPPAGCGTVFKVGLGGIETVLYKFSGGADGGYPKGDLTRDAAGNLYGTTVYGGDLTCNPPQGCGTVFKLDTTGILTVLHSFAGYPTDGAFPYEGVVLDPVGNLYGATPYGGAFGDGMVFSLDTANTLTVLHSFTGGVDGGNPSGPLLRNASGDLYGTASTGGTGLAACPPYGCGVVFRISPTGGERVLHSFGEEGRSPFAGLVGDSAGNLYGITAHGGRLTDPFCQPQGCGTVFRLDPSGVGTPLFEFGLGNGASPYGTLIRDSAGNLYGTTSIGGGQGGGVVFEITP